jgi:hypothetical protein
VQRPLLSGSEIRLTDDPRQIARFRQALDGGGYTAGAVRDALASDASISRDSMEIPLYLRLLSPDTRLSTLIRLFLLGVPASLEDATSALMPLDLVEAQEMGIVTVGTESVTATLEVVPTEQLLIASDTFRDEATRADHVLGLGPPAKVLAALTVRLPVQSALDLGTGNGVQALLAASHSQRVTAIDINARALRFAAFNAALNGLPPLDLRQGDLFAPVEGATFDLIVCNPPYVISPAFEFVYRDGGARGDAFCERVVRALPEYLREGAFGHVLVSWLHPRDTDWTEPVRRWLDGSGCDAIVLRYATHEPLEYAAAWNRPLRGDADAYGAALDEWLRYFDELGVEAISWGAIVLRRRTAAANWVCAYNPSSDQFGPATEQILRLFAAQDFLAGMRDLEELLDETLVLVPDHRLDETGRLEPGTRAVERSVLSLDGGLRFEVAIDAATATVLTHADGTRSLREVLASVAEAASAPMDAFVASALPVIRRLLELGFLVPEPATRSARERF